MLLGFPRLQEASAAKKHVCTTGKSGTVTTMTCCDYTTDDKTGDVLSVECLTILCEGKGSNCLAAKGAPKINPDELSQFIENNTKVKEPNSDILKDNTTLQENNDDGKEPKAPKLPEDLGSLIHEGR